MPSATPPVLDTSTRPDRAATPAAPAPTAEAKVEQARSPAPSAAPPDDGFERVRSKRRSGGVKLAPSPPKQPARRADVAPWGDASLYEQTAARMPTTFRWGTSNETGHAKAHGDETIKRGLAIMRQRVGAKTPTFIDRVSGDIYRLDRASGFMAVASPDGQVKTCFRLKPSTSPASDQFRQLALTNAVNKSRTSLSELGQQKVARPSEPRGFVSARQELFASATHGRWY